MSKIVTPAQARTMRMIRDYGRPPGNTTGPLLRRLQDRNLIINQRSWRLTEAGKSALDAIEIDQASRNLTAKCASILG